jgi:hypothetical protein
MIIYKVKLYGKGSVYQDWFHYELK